MPHTTFLVTSVTAAGTAAGIWLGQTIPIGDQTAVTLGLLCTAVAGAFTVGTLLTGIKRDIKELREAIHNLPCRGPVECPPEHKKR